MMSTLRIWDTVFAQKNYGDDFGWNAVWTHEQSLWLNTAFKYDARYFQRAAKRVRTERQRDDWLAELMAAFYIKNAGGHLFQLEPSGRKEHSLDFSFTDEESQLWMTEVKRPSWRREIWDDDSLSTNQKKARLQQPKFWNDGRSFSFDDAIADSVRKASQQFDDGHKNLLVIVPDTFVSLRYDTFLDNHIREWVSCYDERGTISAALVLEAILSAGSPGVEYHSRIISIHSVPSLGWPTMGVR